MGCGAVLLPSVPDPNSPSPTHPDNDPVWSALEANDIPFMLHIGGGGQLMRPAFHDNGRKVTDFLGGGENIRSKDYMAIHMPPEVFLSCLVLDGVFERFPGLRGGCIEQGAMWVVPWLKRLDLAQYTFRKTEPDLALSKAASEYVHGHLWFTPFPTEPVGWMIEQAGDDLFLFSSDYPHPEGGRDPLGRFESSLSEVSDASKQRFYADNFAAMMGGRVMSGACGSRLSQRGSGRPRQRSVEHAAEQVEAFEPWQRADRCVHPRHDTLGARARGVLKDVHEHAVELLGLLVVGADADRRPVPLQHRAHREPGAAAAERVATRSGARKS